MSKYHSELLSLIAKLLALSIKPNLETQKKQTLTTDKMTAAYMACDGKRTISKITESAGYTSPTSVA